MAKRDDLLHEEDLETTEDLRAAEEEDQFGPEYYNAKEEVDNAAEEVGNTARKAWDKTKDTVQDATRDLRDELKDRDNP